MNLYEQKQEARRARLEAAADRAHDRAEAGHRRADAIVAAIPFGQPILVGHHSEGRHRADLKRLDQGMRTWINETERAGKLAARADAVGTGGISSDDPDALRKLRAELADVEARQTRMVEANKEARAAGRQAPYAGFQLSNNGANARRIRTRIEQLEARRALEPKTTTRAGVTICENVDENRLQMVFPGKPAPEIRAELKARGFRWAPTANAWQRQLNNAARYAAECVLKSVEELPG